jgi:two-component system response regulator FixJ
MADRSEWRMPERPMIGTEMSVAEGLEEARGVERLTPREREVLDLLTAGASNKEAGRHLGISPRTIEVHRAHIMEKLGARNTADLVRIALSQRRGH